MEEIDELIGEARRQARRAGMKRSDIEKAVADEDCPGYDNERTDPGHLFQCCPCVN
jgi:hypothetical protein